MVTEYLQDSLLALVAIFVILLFTTHYFYKRNAGRFKVAIASGSLLMALGAFAADCLPALGMPLSLMAFITLEIAALWLYLGISLLLNYCHGELPLSRLIDQINIGTWVAGTAIVALLINQVEPLLHGSIVLLTIVDGILWAIYLVIIIHVFSTYAHKKFQLQVTGAILLGTVSTELIVLLLHELFKDDMPTIVYQTLIILGLAYYVIAISLVVRYYWRIRSTHLVGSWRNENAIIYGSLATSGIAIIHTQVFSDWLVIMTWCAAMTAFVVVILLDMSRLILRLNIKNLLKAVGIYHPSQWTKIYAMAALYAFARQYYYAHYAGSGIAYFVFTYGLYVVTALVTIELIIAIKRR